MPVLSEVLPLLALSASPDPAAAPETPLAAASAGIEAGFEILGVWGLAARVTDRTHRGRVDAVGLRAGFLTGPSPVFGNERTLGALFAAGALDLFHTTPWQLEITAGPALLDHSPEGRAGLDGFDDAGLVLGVAGRIREGGAFQMNVGPILLADLDFEHLLVLVDLSPGWQWGTRGLRRSQTDRSVSRAGRPARPWPR
ncbi:MAG: hypothetical protein JXB39_01265 [Deltaproteobacteria bacterium]|nr:hypothetical protein [Deltaproteobacteria bacterium]